ncbi:MAG: ATP-binding cassette, subfamily bacterial, partial [Pseudonocardiales bacterium]|nr:ATP-binding cassette, subfamily bacterial [Pseudonocardiales bacterium]
MTSNEQATWLRRLFGYCLRHRADLIGAFGSSLIGALVSVSVPLVIKHVIDLVSQGSG